MPDSSLGSAVKTRKSLTYKGQCTVHEDATTKAWFYEALAAAVRPGDPDAQAAFVQHLDSPRRVVFEVVPEGRIGFDSTRMWRDTPDCSTNHTLSYARSRDLLHWENSRGEPLALPITLANGEVIDAAGPREGLINMTFNLGFDAQQRPVVVYHRYDAQHRSQAFAAHPGVNGWAVKQISAWDFKWAFSGGGSIPAEVTLSAPRLMPDGNLSVDFSTQSVGAGRWILNGATLERIAQLPPAPPVLPETLARPSPDHVDMEVQTAVSRANGRRWVLRWETLPRNRDLPRDSAPPPTELSQA